MTKVTLSFELGSFKNRSIEAGVTRKFQKTRIFEEIIKEILGLFYNDSIMQNQINIDQIKVFINRPAEKERNVLLRKEHPLCPFAYPIRIPPHKEIENKDLELPVEAVIEKYNISVFTLYYQNRVF